MTDEPDGPDIDLDSDSDTDLVPSRRTARRARRRLMSAGVASSTSSDPLSTLLSAVSALQASSDALADDVRDVRRRLSALSSRIELLDQRLTEGEATTRLRTSDPDKKTTARARKRASPRKVSGG